MSIENRMVNMVGFGDFCINGSIMFWCVCV